MSDFTSSFWDYYVMGLVAFGIAFCIFALVTNTTKPLQGDEPELHGHVWDETLAEYNNPLPRWWMGLFWMTILFAVAYLVVFPGFGSNKGVGNWTSTRQYRAEMNAASEKLAPLLAQYKATDLVTLSQNQDAMEMGKRMFQSYCAQCHGESAKGGRGFPNLTDNDWLYGGEPEMVETSILEGRQGVMTPFGPVIGEEGVKDVANYVRSLSGLPADSLRAQRGVDIFQQNCVACHGPEAKGNQLIGAPNLTDKTWLYSSHEAAIMDTVRNGRMNKMPSFREFLGEEKVHVLAAYVLSLSKQSDK